MQPEFSCITHGKQLIQVCLHRSCQKPKLLCQECIQKHDNRHKIVEFKKFTGIFNYCSQTFNHNTYKIKQYFKSMRQAFRICIDRTEERTLNSIRSFTAEMPPLKIGDLESQQIYGMAESILGNPIFRSLVEQQNTKKYQQFNKKCMEEIQIEIQNLKSQTMVNINKYASYIAQKKTKYDINQAEVGNTYALEGDNLGKFVFSDQWKSPLLAVSKGNLVLTRTGHEQQGLTVYGVVNQPLRIDKDSIIFKIQNQKMLYMYFGVCSPTIFSKHQYKGRVYEMGNKMYAIRQNHTQGKKAITLHNSLSQYSNRQMVPWDLQFGDTIKIKIQRKNGGLPEIVFEKNSHPQKFIMPLDKDTKQFYPFVGMKYMDDSISIVDRQNPGQKYQPPKPQKSEPKPSESKIKKGFFGFG